MDELTNTLRTACEEQAKGVTTFIEVILNQELGEPFRRDAMKKPVEVAGIKAEDMSQDQLGQIFLIFSASLKPVCSAI